MYCYKWSWLTVLELARGLGSLVKNLTADPGIASSIPLTPTKKTDKGDMTLYWFFPETMLLCISALQLAR